MTNIPLKDAAKKHGVTYCALWRAAKRKSLKTVKINGVFYTTDEWLKEYKSNIRNKEQTSFYNGKKVFDIEKGEYSPKAAARFLGIKKSRIYWLIYAGYLKSVRKGSYHVITHESLEAYLNTEQNQNVQMAS